MPLLGTVCTRGDPHTGSSFVPSPKSKPVHRWYDMLMNEMVAIVGEVTCTENMLLFVDEGSQFASVIGRLAVTVIVTVPSVGPEHPANLTVHGPERVAVYVPLAVYVCEMVAVFPHSTEPGMLFVVLQPGRAV
jgi:uncharacterized protein (DUF2342 family)